jgi:transposase
VKLLITSTTAQRLTDEQIAALGFAPLVTLAVQANAAVMRALQQQIAVLEERLAERMRIDPDS